MEVVLGDIERAEQRAERQEIVGAGDREVEVAPPGRRGDVALGAGLGLGDLQQAGGQAGGDELAGRRRGGGVGLVERPEIGGSGFYPLAPPAGRRWSFSPPCAKPWPTWAAIRRGSIRCRRSIW